VRKILAFIVALAGVAILAPGAAHPETVGACGWYRESSSFKNVWVYDYSVSGWTTIDYELDTYNNGCGNRYYVSTVWTGDGTPMWLVVTAQKTAPGMYAGMLYRTTGPAFNAVPFNPANVVATPVGTATLSFTDGNTGTFAYTVNGVSQAKAITRQVFTNPGTACQ